MPLYVPAGGVGGRAGVYIDWCIIRLQYPDFDQFCVFTKYLVFVL